MSCHAKNKKPYRLFAELFRFIFNLLISIFMKNNLVKHLLKNFLHYIFYPGNQKISFPRFVN